MVGNSSSTDIKKRIVILKIEKSRAKISRSYLGSIIFI